MLLDIQKNEKSKEAEAIDFLYEKGDLKKDTILFKDIKNAVRDYMVTKYSKLGKSGEPTGVYENGWLITASEKKISEYLIAKGIYKKSGNGNQTTFCGIKLKK